MDNYSIDLEEYCKNCPEFDVHVVEESHMIESVSMDDPWRNVMQEYIERSLTCKHRKRCANMMKWLKNKVKEND